MNGILDGIRLSISRLYLENETESRGDSSHLCGLPTLFSSSAGGVMKIDALTYIYGRTIQAFLDTNYAGLQCTSMSLAAIIYNRIHPKFTPKAVNKILIEGNRLHSLLRDEIKLSNHADGKVAVEEIPHLSYLYIGKFFNRRTQVRLRQECQNVFTSGVEGFECFLTIKQYLEKWRHFVIKRLGFLISIRESSYAIILKKNGKISLFDSHGHLKINGEMIKEKAGILKMPSLYSLERLLTDMYGAGEQAVIAPVSVSFYPIEYYTEKSVPRKSKQPSPEYKPIFLQGQTTENKTSLHVEIADDNEAQKPDNEAGIEIKSADYKIDECETSPYIAMIGGSY